MTNGHLTINIILLLLLLMASGLASGSEIALFSLTKKDIEEIEKQRKKHLIENLLERPKKLLATILIVNNFINIAIVVISVQITNLIFANIEPWLKFILEIGLVSFTILFFGEILPKIYASRNAVLFSMKVADLIHVLNIGLSPISMPMRSFSIFVEKKFKQQSSNFSVDHLSHALELTSNEETTKEEHKILQGIVNFGNTDTRQVMKPRIDVFALNESASFSEILLQIIENGYSRVPIYKENLDTVVGVLYSKDLLPHIDKKDFKWTGLLRQPYFVPENKKLDDLLKEFQEKKIHLAIVVDEYGGTSGIVSLEDIIEQIVGDISDEFDDEDLIYSKLDDNNYIFEGKTNLQEFYKAIDLDDETIFENAKGESETLAGLLLEISGRFPKKGEVIHFDSFKFTVEVLDKKRIKQIKVTLIPSQ
ncbi:MAG: gliding motility-associated protein GldE [Flavobacteriaceae bacterium]|nr:gliding motility-associated protein GldE [Flavobacteriaceae bacterium]MDZ4148786.1 gliding motility-associated protein GldE [Flavobacteriaceae bacterium]